MTITFKYDPFGRRIEKISPTTTSVFVYDGDNLVQTVNSTGGLVAHYAQTMNIDEPLAMQRSGTTYYFEADGLESVTSLSSSAGALANTLTYDSFGNVTNSTGSVTNFLEYTGREFDAETGLYFYRSRYYDSSTGRFLSEDPIEFESGDINFYRYSLNNPVLLRDPFGQQGGVGIGGGVAVGTGVTVQTTVTVVSIEGTSTYAPVLSLISEGSAAGSEAGPIGALVGVIGVTGTYDAVELYKLCEAYGLCSPGGSPNSSPSSATSSPSTGEGGNPPPCKKGKWHCTAKCHVNNVSNIPNAPRFVTGEGWGSSIGEAQLAAEKDANSRVPRGTYKRHCTFKCVKQ